MKFDFFSKTKDLIDENEYSNLLARKENVYKKFQDEYMTGWTNKIADSEIDRFIEVSREVKKHSKCLVVIGIGGSFLGSYAVKEMLTPYFNDKSFEVIYAGTTLSSKYMKELLEYLSNVDFSVNVISKSGTTMETTMTYRLIRKLMEDKYSEEELVKRIIVTTDKEKGSLRVEANKCGYTSFEIPDDIGGRYSIMTAAHLFPLAFNVDIKKLVDGYYKGENYREEAYQYAVLRNCLYRNEKVIENFVVYEEKMYYFTEWLKQLFGETEGKEGKGVFPVSTVHTRDLHSLGQFIQEGNKIIFETFIKIRNSESLIYNGKDLHDISKVVLESVRQAHYGGGVPSIEIEIDAVNEEEIGIMMYFFMLSAAFSGYLFDINPFDQPGVEVYKKEVRENLGVL